MRDFHQLQIWQRSHKLTLEVYKLTSRFPKEEVYGLTSQIRRAMYSVPTNICEGCGRKSAADFARFLQVSVGSASEVEYELLLAHDLNYLNDEDYSRCNSEIIEIRKMINNYINKLNNNDQ